MKKRVTHWILLFLFLLPVSGLTKGKKYRFGEIKEENGLLVVNFQMRDLFGNDVLRGLQKGMTAAIEYHVQLWKDRPHWVNQLTAEKIVRMKVSFDNWERRYVLATPEGEPRLLNEDGIRQRCSELVNFPIAPLEKLESRSRYTITIRVILQPMSVESYQEITRWLSGEVKELNPKTLKSTKSPGKKAGNWLLGLVLNLTGFGDRVISAKSPAFTWTEGSVVLEEER